MGAYLLDAGVTESWMSCTAGLLFCPALLLLCGCSRIPARRGWTSPRRVRPAHGQCGAVGVFRRRWGLDAVVLVFLLITTFAQRSGLFAPEIWAGLQTTIDPTGSIARAGGGGGCLC